MITEIKLPNANISNFFNKKQEYLYSRSYDSFCWSFIPTKRVIINYYSEIQKKLNEHLNEKTISENNKNEIIQKINKINKPQEDADAIYAIYEDLKGKNSDNYTFNDAKKKYQMIM